MENAILAWQRAAKGHEVLSVTDTGKLNKLQALGYGWISGGAQADGLATGIISLSWHSAERFPV